MSLLKRAREISGLTYAVTGYLALVGTIAIATVYREIQRAYEKTHAEQRETRESQSPLETEKVHEAPIHHRTP